ncbi:MAG TPA: pyridoxal phosphate-dependent aminotransferase [Patescibacteria group bacterium]|nr:pyridoxal phosphate-dependent aminotransferase [Patescibacteria group bacterium]
MQEQSLTQPEYKFFKREQEDIIKAVSYFCEYHDLLHKYVKRGVIKSSLDRGAFVRPQDLLPSEIIELLAYKRDSHSYAYGPEKGDYILREKISDVENVRHGTEYTLEWIAMMPGAWASLEFALEEVLQFKQGTLKKRRVVVIGPTLYQMFYYPIQSLGIEVIAYDFVKPNSSHIPLSMEDIEEILKTKPSVIIITNPNNPDGKYFPTPVLEKLVEKAEEYGFYIFIDELQNFFPLRATTELCYGPWIQSPQVVRVDSAAKRYALAEYRVGWIIAHPKLLGNRIGGIVGRMSGIMGNAPRAANTALITLMDKEKEKLQTGKDLFESKWKELLEKEKYVTDRLLNMPHVNAIYPRDACINLTVYIDYEGSDLLLAEELMKQGTLIMPGSGYGYNSTPPILRITFAERYEKLKHSLDALENVLKNNG